MVREIARSDRGARFKDWQMPVSQISGMHIEAPQLVSMLSFETVKDYDDYIARCTQVADGLRPDDRRTMRKGMADGLMPPKFLLEKVVDQAEGIADATPEESPFARAAREVSCQRSPPPTRRGSARRCCDAIRDGSCPRTRSSPSFVKDEYAPKGRTESGVWSLPDGDALYAFQVKQSTTTDMTPEEIHQIGLQQVARDREAEAGHRQEARATRT